MNSALKPVLSQPGVQPSGQGSPAKGNVANVNHSVGHPQGAQNSIHHGSNNMVGQNLTHHAPIAPQLPPHPVPSMAPVSANMAQMAQNMSHHGNLSHVTQNSVTPANTAASPSKSATTSALSLVQEKTNASQPLALTRTPDKKDENNSQANGTIESPKSGTNTVNSLKPQNPELNKDKQDIAKTSPSTPKPPEKPLSTPTTPQKSENSKPIGPTEAAGQPKLPTPNEIVEKSPTKPTEIMAASAADVAPSQSDRKLVPESASDPQNEEKALVPQVQEPSTTESAKTESSGQLEEKKEEPKEENPVANVVEEIKEIVKTDKPETEKTDEESEKIDIKEKIKPEQKPEEKKLEPKLTPSKIDNKPTPKSTLKLATVTTPIRKRRQPSPKSIDGPSSAKKQLDGEGTPDTRTKRNRTKVQLYQSPTPELTMATKLSASAGRNTPTKQNDDKLIVFYKNEYLAVRNAEGSFYVCQAMQNVYRSTRKIKIRWLSQDDEVDPSGETYKPDFYDTTDKECVLTTLSMTRLSGGAMALRPAEQARVASILERALKAEQLGHNDVELTEEHPDGCELSLDLSLYKDESQLDKKSRKRSSSKSSPRGKQTDVSDTADEDTTPPKKARTTPKRSPKSARKPIVRTPIKKPSPIKKKSTGSTPTVAATSKVGIVQRIYRNTATAVTEKVKPVYKTPVKRTQVKPSKPERQDTPIVTSTRKGRSSFRGNKSSPVIPIPSTSTGKATRTPRKPPSKK